MLNNNKIKRVRSAFAFTRNAKENPQAERNFKLSYRTLNNHPQQALTQVKNSKFETVSHHKIDRKLSASLINKWLAHDKQERLINEIQQERPLYSSSSWRAIHSARSQQKLSRLNKQISSPAIKINLTQKINRIKTKHVQKQKKFKEQKNQRKKKQQQNRIQTDRSNLKFKSSQIRKDIDGILNKWQKQYIHLKDRYMQRLKKGYRKVELSETCNKKWQQWFLIYQ